MFVFRGWGILAVLLPFGALVAMDLLVNAILGPGSYQRDVPLWGGLGFVIGGISVWFIGRRLNGGRGRILVDKTTGQEVVLKSVHSLFFIRMEYWGALSVVGGLAMIVYGLFA
jgi:hypothetical protein